jgi:CheY-like chemotaxis protein
MKLDNKREINILIVEDDEISSKLLQRMIKRKFMSFISVRTAIEAIDLLKSGHDKFDIILMDIKLPKMDGLTATKEIRKFDKNVIIIAQTAYAFKKDELKALEAGCNDYISKPIDEKKLFNIIDRMLEE